MYVSQVRSRELSELDLINSHNALALAWVSQTIVEMF